MALTAVLWSCAVIAVLLVLIVCHLVLARVLAVMQRRRQREFERVWLPVLMQGIDQVPDSLPALRRRDTATFLTLWNRLGDALKGGTDSALLQLALRLQMDQAARRLFSHTRVTDKLLAITTAGRLGDRTMWSALVRVAGSTDLDLSLAAARAMVRIEPRSATTLLLPLIAAREDWPPSTIAHILEEAGADVISEPLVKAALRARPEDAHRLIRYFGLAHAVVTGPLLRQLIRDVKSDESAMACLRVFADAGDVDAILPHLQHARWEVRVRAVDALKRLGTARDADLLVMLLSDFEWWVRYRAAQAICTLLRNDTDRITRLRAQQSDPFARDILAHVLAEQAAA